MISHLELADAKMRESSLQQQWFGDADAGIRSVSGQCNGQLFEQLLQASGYCDVACVRLLRSGAHGIRFAACMYPSPFLCVQVHQ